MDHIDEQILVLLQQDARIKQNRIAAEVGLTIPAVSERIRKLLKSGVITGYHAKIDPKKMGRDVTAFIFVHIDSSKHYDDFVKRTEQNGDIFECHSITGEGTHILKIRTKNTSSLERLLSTIQSWPGVTGTKTNVVLSSFKENSIYKTSI